MKPKIGVGVITCNREEFCKKLIKSIPEVDAIVAVNDGHMYASRAYDGVGENAYNIKILHTKVGGGEGVGKAKNKALQALLKQKCDYYFIIEDDMLIKNPDVFNAYIECSKATGLQHLMFGYHGPANKNNNGPNPRLIVDYGTSKVALNLHCVGSFCMYTHRVLQEVGLMDEAYVNAWEHVDHSYLISKLGYIPGFWWWPDLANSYDYIDEQACSETNSTIRPRADWQKNIQKGAEHFYQKHKCFPVTVPDLTVDQVKLKLKEIYKTWR